jgi:8-oxo-dGTP pyrophosphatase MutT (NUDIX family)
MFFPSAKIIVRHHSDKNKILLIKRNVNGVISYEPAGGRAEIDYQNLNAESLEECVIREAAEELGVRVSIEKYVGSYSYFWPHDLSNCSCYAVFVGNITQEVKNFTGNGDKDCWPVTPEWVTLEDIFNKKIVINPTHKGLEELVLNSFKSKS